jgi:hypothetical protein
LSINFFFSVIFITAHLAGSNTVKVPISCLSVITELLGGISLQHQNGFSYSMFVLTLKFFGANLKENNYETHVGKNNLIKFPSNHSSIHRCDAVICFRQGHHQRVGGMYSRLPHFLSLFYSQDISRKYCYISKQIVSYKKDSYLHTETFVR